MQTFIYGLLRNFFTSICLILLSEVSTEAAFNLNRNQIKSFDLALVARSEDQCRKLAGTTGIEFQNWVLDEAKKAGYSEAKSETLKTEEWLGQIEELKFNDENMAATWVVGSPGTYGSLNGQPINNGLEKQAKGMLVDVGQGATSDLKKVSLVGTGVVPNQISKDDAIKNKLANASLIKADPVFWLAEQSDEIPLYALALEAQGHKAQALFIYTTKDRVVKPDIAVQNRMYPLPVITLSYKEAQELSKKIKSGAVKVSLKVHTEFPVSKNQVAVTVKATPQDYGLIISATRDQCHEVAVMLGLLSWLNQNKLRVHSTSFIFIDAPSKLATQKALGQHFYDFSHLEEGEFEPKKFLARWFGADKFPDKLIDVRSLTQRAEKLSVDLKGLVDGDVLKKYRDDVRRFQNLSSSARAAIAFRLDQIYADETLFKTGDDIKALRETYTSVQRGLWAKAQNQSAKISGFALANRVSLETFIGYEKAAIDHGAGIDPQVWILLQKGKPSADELLKDIEIEIDRLTQRLNESFEVLAKYVAEIQKSGG